jgi:hypothetical protein
MPIQPSVAVSYKRLTLSGGGGCLKISEYVCTVHLA